MPPAQVPGRRRPSASGRGGLGARGAVGSCEGPPGRPDPHHERGGHEGEGRVGDPVEASRDHRVHSQGAVEGEVGAQGRVHQPRGAGQQGQDRDGPAGGGPAACTGAHRRAPVVGTAGDRGRPRPHGLAYVRAPPGHAVHVGVGEGRLVGGGYRGASAPGGGQDHGGQEADPRRQGRGRPQHRQHGPRARVARGGPDAPPRERVEHQQDQRQAGGAQGRAGDPTPQTGRAARPGILTGARTASAAGTVPAPGGSGGLRGWCGPGGPRLGRCGARVGPRDAVGPTPQAEGRRRPHPQHDADQEQPRRDGRGGGGAGVEGVVGQVLQGGGGHGVPEYQAVGGQDQGGATRPGAVRGGAERGGQRGGDLRQLDQSGAVGRGTGHYGGPPLLDRALGAGGARREDAQLRARVLPVSD